MADVQLIGVLVSGAKSKVTGGKRATIDSVLRAIGGNLRLETSGTQVELESGKAIVSLGAGALVNFDTINGIAIDQILTKDGNLVMEFVETGTVPGGPPGLGDGTGKIWLRTDGKLIFTGDDQIDVVIGSVVGGASAFVEQEFTPTSAQTVFTLSSAFVGGGGLSIVSVNGAVYSEGTDYTIAGTTLIWLDTPFVLETTDCLVVRYQIS